MPTVWFTAMRRGTPSALRSARANLFYPVFLDAKSGRLHSVGDALPKDVDRRTITTPKGAVTLWPLHTDGTEQTWRFNAARMREKFAAGTARLGRRDPDSGERPITYLQPGTLKNIKDVLKTVAEAASAPLVNDAIPGAAPAPVVAPAAAASNAAAASGAAPAIPTK